MSWPWVLHIFINHHLHSPCWSFVWSAVSRSSNRTLSLWIFIKFEISYKFIICKHCFSLFSFLFQWIIELCLIFVVCSYSFSFIHTWHPNFCLSKVATLQISSLEINLSLLFISSLFYWTRTVYRICSYFINSIGKDDTLHNTKMLWKCGLLKSSIYHNNLFNLLLFCLLLLSKNWQENILESSSS